MFCLSCGKKISKISRFCKYCGSSQITKKKISKKEYEIVWTCDYCKTEFPSKKLSDEHEIICANNPKNNKFPFNTNPKKGWTIFWLTTITVFILTCFISAKFVEKGVILLNRDVLLVMFFGNICLGVIAFFCIAFSKSKPNNNKLNGLIKYSLIICLVYLIINPSIFIIEGCRAFQDEGYKNKYYTDQKIIPTPLTTPTPISTLTPTIKPKSKTVQSTNTSTTQSGQIECIGPDGKQFKTTMADCKALNEKWGKPVDYMTNCNYSNECVGGGGIKYVKKSECDKPCTRTSSGSNNNQTNNTRQSPGNNFYCWSNAYGYAYYTSSGDQCNLDNLKSGNYKLCMDIQNGKNDSCKSSCKNELEKNNSACAWAYTGSNAGIEQSSTKYGECLNGSGGSSELYGTCLGNCTDQYGQDIKQCSY